MAAANKIERKPENRQTMREKAKDGGRITVCYFGSYNKPFPRNHAIRAGLERNGINVVECWTPLAGLFARYWKLARLFIRQGRGCDSIVVGEARHLDVPLARALGALFGKKVILDVFVSHYDSWVLDRTDIRPGSRQAFVLAMADFWGAKLAHYSLLDTSAHIDFYADRYRIPKEKFRRIFATSDNAVFSPTGEEPTDDGKFHVLFHGSYLPLHGLEHIIRAAKILENETDIVFDMVGGGYLFEDIKKLNDELGLKNTVFFPITNVEGIRSFISRCHVCLGIFGTTGKSQRVIPNKAFEAVAMRRPLISADSPGMREMFTDRRDILFCRAGDAKAIADSILELKNDAELRESIAKNGYELFAGNYLPEMCVAPLIELLEKFAEQRR
jgi:glycosyltransferase involved in cell wall biosynthesis